MKRTFDGRGEKCPLGFVKAKQQLLLGKTKDYLLDDEMTLYNFISYLEKQQIKFVTSSQEGYTLVTLV